MTERRTALVGAPERVLYEDTRITVTTQHLTVDGTTTPIEAIRDVRTVMRVPEQLSSPFAWFFMFAFVMAAALVGNYDLIPSVYPPVWLRDRAITRAWLFACVAVVMSVVYVVRGARRTTNVVYVTTKDTRRDIHDDDIPSRRPKARERGGCRAIGSARQGRGLRRG